MPVLGTRKEHDVLLLKTSLPLLLTLLLPYLREVCCSGLLCSALLASTEYHGEADMFVC